ncbi:MAG TPA: hypothetical protein VMR70_21385 [Flavisolibacter sp.]|nr:hypothetical protein [Flavisolibacter sp.]
MMAVYAYADETIFNVSNSTNGKALGCGIFISQEKVTQTIIDTALADLKIDPDLDAKKDHRTMGRGFFHASDDSKNAHSYLCAAINQHVKGVFDFSYYENVDEKDFLRKKFRENIFSRCLNFSTLEFFNSAKEVHLIIEKRDELSASDTTKWLKNLYRLYEGAVHDIPSFKTYFPKIKIELRNKREPGLQIVDFLMWVVCRTKRKPPDEKWRKRLQFKTWHYYRDENGHNRGQYYLNCFPQEDSLLKNYPHPFQKPIEWHSFIDAYILIERFLISLDKSDFTLPSNHLFEEFDLASTRLKDKTYHIKSDDLELIGRVFLRLFDTMPLYDHVKDEDEEAWSLLFHAKYVASMLVRNEQLHFHRTKDEILRWRYIMKTERQEEFYQLIANE